MHDQGWEDWSVVKAPSVYIEGQEFGSPDPMWLLGSMVTHLWFQGSQEETEETESNPASLTSLCRWDPGSVERSCLSD